MKEFRDSGCGFCPCGFVCGQHRECSPFLRGCLSAAVKVGPLEGRGLPWGFGWHFLSPSLFLSVSLCLSFSPFKLEGVTPSIKIGAAWDQRLCLPSDWDLFEVRGYRPLQHTLIELALPLSFRVLGGSLYKAASESGVGKSAL